MSPAQPASAIAANSPPAPTHPCGPQATLAALRAGQLTGVTRLDLRGCGLQTLPPELLALANTLELLDLSGNELQTLPASLAGLHRLHTLFASDNLFTTLPAVLGRCPALDTLGLRANQIAELPADALAPTLRWLILTDNRIRALPDSLLRCTRLQKLMLAGNRLSRLPAGLPALQRLELLRLSANQFETAAAALPDDLLALPKLAWLAHAGNPFSQASEQAAEAGQSLPDIAWQALQLDGLLGEGASGQIHAARWQRDGTVHWPVAVKLFKGAVTSDGLPRSEMAACLAAGRHRHLVGVEGRLVGHPDGRQGLVLPRIAPQYRPLAGPPSMASCSRDVYAAGLRLPAAQAVAIAEGSAAALAHLHRQGLMHGDLYAHNLLVDDRGDSLLSDFGAASFLPRDDRQRRAALQALDRRALAVLVDELAQHCDDPSALGRWRCPD